MHAHVWEGWFVVGTEINCTTGFVQNHIYAKDMDLLDFPGEKNGPCDSQKQEKWFEHFIANMSTWWSDNMAFQNLKFELFLLNILKIEVSNSRYKVNQKVFVKHFQISWVYT